MKLIIVITAVFSLTAFGEVIRTQPRASSTQMERTPNPKKKPQRMEENKTRIGTSPLKAAGSSGNDNLLNSKSKGSTP